MVISMLPHTHVPINRSVIARILSAAFASILVLGLLWWLSPILDHHEGTAAWVQAVGALLIIGATAWIASRSSREAQERESSAKRQLWESIAVLAQNCLSAVDTLLKGYPSSAMSDPRGNFLRSYAPSDFDVPMDGLAAVPLHQIGDTALVTAVLTLRGIMGRIKKHLDDVLRDPALSQTLEPVRNQRTQALNAVANVMRIVQGNAAENEISRLASHL
jgi:hypothetical protein